MYVRKVRGETLEFGHQGWLLDESFLLFDRQTSSLWIQATGKCIRGKYKGEQLTTLPVTHTTWGEWKALHPDTVVLAKPPQLVDRYRVDAYTGFYARQGTRFGLAVFVDGGQKLYPLDVLKTTPVVHDTIGEHAVLVVFHAPSRTAVAFEPKRDDEVVRFELAEVAEQDVVLRDPANGSLWSGLTGRPQSSGQDRAGLKQLRTTQFTMSNWPRHFPDGPVYRP